MAQHTRPTRDIAPLVRLPAEAYIQQTSMNRSPFPDTPAHAEPENALSAGCNARDSRKTFRYSLQAQVMFSWEDRHGARQDASGRTLNISHKGAYVIAAECPAVGARVSLTIFLPALGGETRTLHLETKGRVTRAEPAKNSESEIGFAVSNAWINLRAS